MDAFIGEIRAFPYDFVPDNWLPCDGKEYQAGQFQQLYAVISTLYGGSSTTFKVPNLKELVVAGKSTQDRDFYPIGRIAGTKSVSLTVAEIPSHNHAVKAFLHSQAQNQYLTNQPASSAFLTNATTKPDSGSGLVIRSYSNGPLAPGDTLLNENTIGSAGNSFAHENRQPYLTFRYCICVYSDYFPVRS